MKYEKIVKAKFIERKNRFVASAELADGSVAAVHVKNTGRCKELLLPGVTVYLEDFEGRMGTRKMQYSLIGVEKMVGVEKMISARKAISESSKEEYGQNEHLMINMDSQAPNKVVEEALKDGTIRLPGMETLTKVKPEQKYGNSRFDFYLEGADAKSPNPAGKSEVVKAYAEVKGVTLEDGGFARFPDAPTERGLKHIEELCTAADEGYKAYIIFVIQMKKIHTFGPNYVTQPAFGEALIEAQRRGVQILAYDCLVTADTLKVDSPVSIELDRPAE